MSITLNTNLASLQSLLGTLPAGDLKGLDAAMPMLQALLAPPSDAYQAPAGTAPSIAALPLPPPTPSSLSNASGRGAYPAQFGDPAMLSTTARENTFNYLQLMNDPNAALYANAPAATASTGAGPISFGPQVPMAYPQVTGNPPGYAPGTDPLTPTSAGANYVNANQSYLGQLDPQQQAYFKLQQQVNAQAEAASLMAAVAKAKHDSLMAIIQKMS